MVVENWDKCIKTKIKMQSFFTTLSWQVLNLKLLRNFYWWSKKNHFSGRNKLEPITNSHLWFIIKVLRKYCEHNTSNKNWYYKYYKFYCITIKFKVLLIKYYFNFIYYVFNSHLPITLIVISIYIYNVIKFVMFLIFSKQYLVYIYVYSGISKTVHWYWSALKYVVHLTKPKWTRIRNQIGNVGGLSPWPPIRCFPLWKWRWTLVLKDLLNPISGRDASHSCLISLWPIKGIVRFGWQSLRHVRQHASPLQTTCASSFWDLLYYTCVVVVHSSLGQRLIWHEWEASLPNVGLSKSLRTKA